MQSAAPNISRIALSEELALFKGPGDIASIMKQAQEMGTRMQSLNAQLKTQRAVGIAGAGMVEVEVNGVGEVLRISIEPQLIESGDREMIEDLVPAAVNQALAKAKQMHVDAMQELTGGLNVPGLSSALEEMTGPSE